MSSGTILLKDILFYTIFVVVVVHAGRVSSSRVYIFRETITAEQHNFQAL